MEDAVVSHQIGSYRRRSPGQGLTQRKSSRPASACLHRLAHPMQSTTGCNGRMGRGRSVWDIRSPAREATLGAGLRGLSSPGSEVCTPLPSSDRSQGARLISAGRRFLHGAYNPRRPGKRSAWTPHTMLEDYPSVGEHPCSAQNLMW
jgi:hypothetical protein